MRNAMRWLKILHRIIILMVLQCGLFGCSSDKLPTMELHVHAAPYLNPNINDQPSPVVVTVYQLKSATAFQQANFYTIENDPTAILDGDLLDKYEFEIEPDQKKVIDLNNTLDTHYIGIVAQFRDPDNAAWRQLIAVKSGEASKLMINLSAQHLSAQLQKGLF